MLSLIDCTARPVSTTRPTPDEQPDELRNCTCSPDVRGTNRIPVAASQSAIAFVIRLFMSSLPLSQSFAIEYPITPSVHAAHAKSVWKLGLHVPVRCTVRASSS